MACVARRRRRVAGVAGCSSLALVGGALALALSEGLRKKVLDALFGAEEEFEYTASTTPEPSSNARARPQASPSAPPDDAGRFKS